MSAYQVTRNAILSKKQIVATYKSYRREMCPHVLGTKNGKNRVLFFQFAGGSSTGLPLGGEWRCVDLDELENVSSREGEWHTARTRSGKQTCVGYVDVEVAY